MQIVVCDNIARPSNLGDKNMVSNELSRAAEYQRILYLHIHIFFQHLCYVFRTFCPFLIRNIDKGPEASLWFKCTITRQTQKMFKKQNIAIFFLYIWLSKIYRLSWSCTRMDEEDTNGVWKTKVVFTINSNFTQTSLDAKLQIVCVVCVSGSNICLVFLRDGSFQDSILLPNLNYVLRNKTTLDIQKLFQLRNNNSLNKF